MIRFKSVALTGLVGITLVTGCSSSEDEGRPGTVAEASYSGLKAVRPDGVALQAGWGQQLPDQLIGDKSTPPEMMKATCFGEYPDLRVVVEGPDNAILRATAGESTMNLTFGEMGPTDVQPPADSYTWGPTGLEVDLRMSTGSDEKEEELSKDFFGGETGGFTVRMLVTCA
ncbi:hypothetical protein [Rhodococcus oryzae]|jgi:hypothetical protein|uniref:hypothetical protein n=1 Tax=Rhodococcus oryzae TaxID=2571143 RepID=UPI0037B80341